MPYVMCCKKIKLFQHIIKTYKKKNTLFHYSNCNTNMLLIIIQKLNYVVTIVISISLIIQAEEIINCNDFMLNKTFRHNNAVIRVELQKCLPNLGKDPLNPEQSHNIWNNIIMAYDNFIEYVPIDIYAQMRWSINGIAPDDYSNITMDNIDIIEIFGKYRALAKDQMTAIVNKIKIDWTRKTPEMLSHFDLIALGQILCYFNGTEIKKIHADAYKRASIRIGELRDCSPEVIMAFAQLAKQPLAFGSPKNWSKFDVDMIGIIVTGLSDDDYLKIPKENLIINKKLFGNNLNKTMLTARTTTSTLIAMHCL